MDGQPSLTPPPARLNAFRDEYGDPRPPDISRKITACVSCRKHKVNWPNGVQISHIFHLPDQVLIEAGLGQMQPSGYWCSMYAVQEAWLVLRREEEPSNVAGE
jgi:hypothetical protein